MVSVQCWDYSGSLKVLEFWEVVTHPQIMRMSRAVPVAGCCWQRHPSVPVQNWDVRQEKLQSWLGLEWEVSSPGECIPGSGAFCLSHHLPRNSTGIAVTVVRGMDSTNHTGISPACLLGVEEEAGAAGLISARNARKSAALWGEEAKPVLQQIYVFYLHPPLWAGKSGIIQLANLLLPFCLLASSSQLLTLPSLILPSLFSPHNKWTSYSLQRPFGPSLEDLKSVHIPIPHPVGCIWKSQTG